jgi:hypothetical protein
MSKETYSQLRCLTPKNIASKSVDIYLKVSRHIVDIYMYLKISRHTVDIYYMFEKALYAASTYPPRTSPVKSVYFERQYTVHMTFT